MRRDRIAASIIAATVVLFLAMVVARVGFALLLPYWLLAFVGYGLLALDRYWSHPGRVALVTLAAVLAIGLALAGVSIANVGVIGGLQRFDDVAATSAIFAPLCALGAFLTSTRWTAPRLIGGTSITLIAIGLAVVLTGLGDWGAPLAFWVGGFGCVVGFVVVIPRFATRGPRG
jgi:uncharacterized membrane protein